MSFSPYLLCDDASWARARAGVSELSASRKPRIPRVVWAFWFGNEMRGSRLESFRNLRNGIGVHLKLVNDSNLQEFEHPEFPFHPTLNLLSQNHKVDYLRAYFMHFYGGGYHDIKGHKSEDSWAENFSLFDKDVTLWLLGSAVFQQDHVGCDETYAQNVLMGYDTSCSASEQIPLDTVEPNQGLCCELVFNMWQRLVQNGAYIMRPNTAFTVAWLNFLTARLDAKHLLLHSHPSPRPRCCQSGVDSMGYPLRWAEVHGEVFHPLQAKYIDHVRQGLPRWDTASSYRDESEDAAVNPSRQVPQSTHWNFYNGI